MTERTGTELLRDVELKVDELTQFVRNMDNNMKILLGRLNEFMAKSQVQSSIVTPVMAAPVATTATNASASYKFEDLPKTSKFEKLLESANVDSGSTTESAVLNDELTEEVIRKGSQRGQRAAQPQRQTKVSVSQRVLLSDGSAVPIADIKILQNDKVLKQGRTNSHGRWVAALEPGDYEIQLSKNPDGTINRAIELVYNVTVPPSTQPVELQSKSI